MRALNVIDVMNVFESATPNIITQRINRPQPGSNWESIGEDEFSRTSLTHHIFTLSDMKKSILVLIPKDMINDGNGVRVIKEDGEDMVYLKDSGFPEQSFESIIKDTKATAYINWDQAECYVFYNGEKIGPLKTNVGSGNGIHFIDKGVFFIEPTQSSTKGYFVWDIVHKKEISPNIEGKQLKPIEMNRSIVLPVINDSQLVDILIHNMLTGESLLLSNTNLGSRIPEINSCDSTDGNLTLFLDNSETITIDEKCNIVGN